MIYTIITASIMTGCLNSSYNRTEGLVWNTSYHIIFKGDRQLEDSIAIVLNAVGNSLSVFQNGSVVSQVNENLKAPIDCHFEKVYNEAIHINKFSGGYFDPTISPLITAWGFGPGHSPTADTLRIDSLLQFTGINKTHLKINRNIGYGNGDGECNNKILEKDDARIQFNFSAIAKGYGCDEVGAMFRRNGVNDYMVEIGGEIALSGNGPGGGKWRISVDIPSSDNIEHNAFTVLELTDCGIATSGNYRNFRMTNGVAQGHTISPFTGRPVETNVLSATVIAPTCMEADAVATACMAMGLDKAKLMLQELNLEALLILPDSVWTTPNFDRFVSVTASAPGNRDRD